MCCATLYNSRSELCLACSSVATIQQEFLEGWRNTRLRNIGADIALSAARSIRALRIYGKSEDSTYPSEAKEVCKAETKEDSGKPPLERKRRSQGADFEGREKATKKPRAEAHRISTVPRGKEESRGGPAQSSAARPEAPKETASEGSYSSSTEDFEAKDLTGRGKKEHVAGSVTGTTPKSTAEAPRQIAPAVFEAGTAEDKDRSKREYLDSLKHQVVLREGPKNRKRDTLPEALLEVKGEDQEALQREEKALRRAKSDHGRGGVRKQSWGLGPLRGFLWMEMGPLLPAEGRCYDSQGTPTSLVAAGRVWSFCGARQSADDGRQPFGDSEEPWMHRCSGQPGPVKEFQQEGGQHTLLPRPGSLRSDRGCSLPLHYGGAARRKFFYRRFCWSCRKKDVEACSSRPCRRKLQPRKRTASPGGSVPCRRREVEGRGRKRQRRSSAECRQARGREEACSFEREVGESKTEERGHDRSAPGGERSRGSADPCFDVTCQAGPRRRAFEECMEDSGSDGGGPRSYKRAYYESLECDAGLQGYWFAADDEGSSKLSWRPGRRRSPSLGRTPQEKEEKEEKGQAKEQEEEEKVWPGRRFLRRWWLWGFIRKQRHLQLQLNQHKQRRQRESSPSTTKVRKEARQCPEGAFGANRVPAFRSARLRWQPIRSIGRHQGTDLLSLACSWKWSSSRVQRRPRNVPMCGTAGFVTEWPIGQIGRRASCPLHGTADGSDGRGVAGGTPLGGDIATPGGPAITLAARKHAKVLEKVLGKEGRSEASGSRTWGRGWSSNSWQKGEDSYSPETGKGKGKKGKGKSKGNPWSGKGYNNWRGGAAGEGKSGEKEKGGDKTSQDAKWGSLRVGIRIQLLRQLLVGPKACPI